jgi:HPt (histidine-containing phosphotransfer) domain-containing protein
MDDYLSKPVRLGDLETAMRSVPRRERKAPLSKAAPAPSDDAVLDTRVLKDLQDLEASGAAGLLASLVDSFLQDVPKRLTAIEEALARRAAHDVMHQAHTIKGSAAALGVVQVRALAARIEGAANAGDLDGLTGATSLLREELTRAEPALRRVVARPVMPSP